MNKKSMDVMAMAAMIGALAGDSQMNDMHNKGDAQPKPPRPKFVPKGCNVYHFFEDGTILESNRWEFDAYRFSVNHEFSCVAMNEKSAIKKYDKWVSPHM